ncbi:MAG: PIG-L deacetylase family protein [Anaerolineae bacterium]
MEDLDTLSLEGFQRLLVLAPHCDDETLGAGGLILAAGRLGMDVRVVIATNGDGYLFATMEEFRRVYPTPQDFIRMGSLRQQESLKALQFLGISPEQVLFLGYPDRGLAALWTDYWRASKPYRSPYSRADRSPYPLTYNPHAVYAGEHLLGDLLSILKSFRPDVVVYPHPNDTHPDHWGLSAFTRLALALAQQEDPDYHPHAYAYLVHRPGFPNGKGFHLERGLLPPAPLFQVTPRWLRLDLSEGDALRKWAAIQAYQSQFRLMRTFLESFARENELFGEVASSELRVLAEGNPQSPATWQDPEGEPIPPVQRDPARDFFGRDVVAGADLVALYAAQKPDGSLVTCTQVRGRATRTLVYTLRVKAVGPDGFKDLVVHSDRVLYRSFSVRMSGPYACHEVPSEVLGRPQFLFVGAEVRGAEPLVLDRTAWQLVAVASSASEPAATQGGPHPSPAPSLSPAEGRSSRRGWPGG